MLPSLSIVSIRRLLNIENQSKGRVSSYEDHGPGELDKWALLQGDEHPWIQYDPAPPAAAIKIIVSLPEFDIRPPDQVDEEIFNLLIQHYAVYVWQDNAKQLMQAHPITSTRDFWQQIKTVCSASEKSVKETLAKQYIGSNDIRVIDLKTYQYLRGNSCLESNVPYLPEFFAHKWRALRKSHVVGISSISSFEDKEDFVLDFMNVRLTNAAKRLRWANAVEGNTIKTIRLEELPERNEIAWLRRQFPNCENIVLPTATGTWLQEHLPYFEGAGISFTAIKNWDFKTPVKLKRFGMIEFGDEALTMLDITELNSEKFAFNFAPKYFKCADSQLENIIELSLESYSLNFFIENKKILPSLKNLTLIIDRSEVNKLDFSFCPNLEKLTLRAFQTTKHLHCTNLSAVTELVFSGSVEVLQLDNTECLKSISIRHSREMTLLQLNNVPQLEKLSMDLTSIKTMDLSSAVNLKSLIFNGCNELVDCKLPVNCQLTEFTAESSSKMKMNIDFIIYLSRMKSIKNRKLHPYFNIFPLEKIRTTYLIEQADVSSTVQPINLRYFPNLKMVRIFQERNANSLPVSFSYTPNLEKVVLHLDYESALAEKLDFSHLTQVRNLEINVGFLKEAFAWDVAEFLPPPNLQNLSITLARSSEAGHIKHIDFSRLAKLKFLAIHAQALSNADFSQLKGLEKLELNVDKLDQEIALSGLNNLRHLWLDCVNQPSKLTFLPRLEYLCMSIPGRLHEALGRITLDENSTPQLRFLILPDSTTEITLRNLPELYFLQVPKEVKATVENCPKIARIDYFIPRLNSLRRIGNRTSRISFSDDIVIDGDISGKPRELRSEGEYAVTMMQRGKICDHLLLHVTTYDTIQFLPSRQFLGFSKSSPSDITEQSLDCFGSKATFKQRCLEEKMTDKIVGILEIEMIPGQRYPIATYQPTLDIDFYWLAGDKNDIKLIKSVEKQSYYIYSAKKTTIKIGYCCAPNRFYDTPLVAPTAINKKLLSKNFKARINQELKTIPELDFLKKRNISVKAKLDNLIAYFRGYKCIPLISNDAHQLSLFFTSLREATGYCRHRAWGFFVLAQYLGVPAAIVYNEAHAYVKLEVAPKQWQRVDLGGGETLDLALATADPFSTLLAEEEVPSPVFLPVVEKEPLNAYYEQVLDELIKPMPCASVIPILEGAFGKRILIEMSASQSSFQIYATLVHHCNRLAKPYLYINSPDDFKGYWESVHLTDEGERQQQRGLLPELIAQGGVLIVNWDAFTPAQLVIYQSLLDKPPTLFNVSTQSLTIVGLAKENKVICDAVKSRIDKRISLTEAALAIAAPVATQAPASSLSINLFKRSDWRRMLLGKLTIRDNHFILEEGVLIRAIREGHSLIIQNDGQNPILMQFIRQLLTERRVFFNGHYLAVPPMFDVRFEEVPFRQVYQAKVNFLTTATLQQSPAPRIYVHANNYHELFEQTFIHDGVAKNIPGLLETAPEGTIFYWLDTIYEAEYHFLMDHIETRYPNKDFYFYFPQKQNNQQVTPSASATALFRLDFPKTHAVISNDMELAALELKQELTSAGNIPFIVHLTPQTSYSELIMHIDVKFEEEKRLIWNKKEQAAYTQLRQGKTIILCGNINSLLYKQISSLLSAEPHLYDNGERKNISASLRLVLSPEAGAARALGNVTTRHYTCDDYRKIFKEDQAYFDRIQYFLSYARYVPNFLFAQSFYRLKNIIAALKNPNPRNRENPAKGFFLYAYKPNSVHYAYLNCLAKGLLSQPSKGKEKTLPMRVNKLVQLAQTLKLTQLEDLSQHIWPILNCFHAEFLQTLFDAAFLQHIATTPSGSMPTVPASVLHTIWEMIHPHLQLATQQEVKHKPPFDLLTWLRDPHATAIFLKGLPGVGKTYSVKSLGEDGHAYVYKGKEDIVKWLTASETDKPHLLLLDEANTALPGTWDFLKDNEIIYYQGKFYCFNTADNASVQRKLVVTGNFETFAGRYLHRFLFHQMETVLIKPATDQWLQAVILMPLLPAYLKNTVYVEHLLKLYQLFPTYSSELTLSTRDLQSLTSRFVSLAEEKPQTTTSVAEALYEAVVEEWLGAITDIKAREDFIAALRMQLSLSNNAAAAAFPYMRIGEMLMPQSKFSLIESVRQDLRHRNQRLFAASNPIPWEGKQGVLVIGSPGMAKSTLLETLAKEAGLSLTAMDPRQKYYVINAGTPLSAKIILQAFDEGALVIINELNLDPDIEFVLNELMTQKASGFFVLASQNSGAALNRVTLSDALLNRFRICQLTDYSLEEKTAFVEDYGVDPTFMTAWETKKRANPGSLNSRTFFRALETIRDRQLSNDPMAVDAPAAPTRKRKTVDEPDDLALQGKEKKFRPSTP